MGGIADAIIQRHAAVARAKGRAYRRSDRMADQEYRRSSAGIADYGVPLDDDRLADSLDEAFVAERTPAWQERISVDDMTLRHGMISEALYAEGDLVREDVDLADPRLLDILLRDAPQLLEQPLERQVYDVSELDDSLTLERYIEELEVDSEEVEA